MKNQPVSVGCLLMDRKDFNIWCILKRKAQKYYNKNKPVPIKIRKAILVLEGATKDQANYLTQFPEEKLK